MSDDNHLDDLALPCNGQPERRAPRTAAQVRAAMARTPARKLEELGMVAEQAHRRHMKWRRRHLDHDEAPGVVAERVPIRDHNLSTSHREGWFDRLLLRLGAWLFGAAEDDRATVSAWEIRRGSRGVRVYRDPRWDTVHACISCRGFGISFSDGSACPICAGTGIVRFTPIDARQESPPVSDAELSAMEAHHEATDG
jgi:hypothetical protein